MLADSISSEYDIAKYKYGDFLAFTPLFFKAPPVYFLIEST